MTGGFLEYAEFKGFWEHFAPETPFGRDEKQRLALVTDAGRLEAMWDQTDHALGLLDALERDPVRLDRISHHLKRLPRFPREPRPSYTEVELFQFKKFLHNYRALTGLLPAETLAAFGFTFTSEAFGRLLDQGRQSAEAFYVADDYSPGLRAARDGLRDANAGLAEAREARAREIRDAFGLDFQNREFLLAPRATLGEGARTLLILEPYDETHWVARPLPAPRERVLAERREALLAEERLQEDRVLEELSLAARVELEPFKAYQEAVRAFDLAFARARLARRWHLTRPRLGDGPVEVSGGRFVPCEQACAAAGLPYVPLDAAFDASVTVIFGSNMGGKTMALKTLAFLQLCAQTGLFAPAARFTTRVFRHFHYVGEGRVGQEASGLSGFGREIRQFNKVWTDAGQGPTLALFDEFARTTQSQEAEALLSAAMEALAANGRVLALFATHFRGVRRWPGARYLRMKGLDRASLERDLGTPGEAAPGDGQRAVIAHMDFHLVPDDGERTHSDAITVASLLGLDPGIARRAREFFTLTN